MEYKLGTLKNLKDNRDVQVAQIQAPVTVPSRFVTDISFIPVLNQMSLGSCVGHAHAIIHIYNEWKENKVVPKLSPRYLYALSKKIDGYAGEGTYPRTTAGIQVNKGCSNEGYCLNNSSLSHADYINVVETPQMIADALKYRVKGYATVANDKESLKQAIVLNGLVTVSLSVGNFDNPIKKGNLGLHRVVVYGYDGDRFFYRNSWGKEWGGEGNGYFDWNDQQLFDLMVFVDLPNEILEEAKKKYKYFSDKEVSKFKLKPELWKLLDTLRGACGFPFNITSGLRTKSENDKLPNAVEDSAHIEGLAVDVSIPDSSKRFKIVEEAIKLGFTRIGIGSTFVHLDIDKEKPQNVIWLYK